MTIDKKAEELFTQLIVIQAPMPDDMTLEAIERQGIETRAMRIKHLASALRQNTESAAERFKRRMEVETEPYTMMRQSYVIEEGCAAILEEEEA